MLSAIRTSSSLERALINIIGICVVLRNFLHKSNPDSLPRLISRRINEGSCFSKKRSHSSAHVTKAVLTSNILKYSQVVSAKAISSSTIKQSNFIVNLLEKDY